MDNLDKVAEKNIKTRFVDNPCRGIVVGMNKNGKEEGELVQVAWTMGRSQNSQNRVYRVQKDVLWTEAFDPSIVKNPELILYNAMRSFRDAHIVSNGVQTDTIFDEFSKNHYGVILSENFFAPLEQHYCESDPPIFTPRISGYQYKLTGTKAFLSILRPDAAEKEKWLGTIEKHGLKEEQFESRKAFNEKVKEISGLDYNKFPTDRDCYERTLRPGIGYCLTTYRPGSKTLDSFEGTPFVVPTAGPLESIMNNIWNHLEPEWRVSIGGKVIYNDGSYRMATPINRIEQQGEK